MNLQAWKEWAKKLKKEVFTLYLAYQDPRSPFWAKVVTIIVVAYAFSPIDLIPDFIPILGYLDDLILLPLGIALAIKLIPAPVVAESREKAESILSKEKPRSWIAGFVVILLWILLVTGIFYFIVDNFSLLQKES
ncbi:DUF1232 domain-containing protein [Shimazuella sp. AN120528]|uniref:YkvA family protein n=1 Tax=Shimazuella soli TaxID=1892854 RepID=UPI001F10E1BD|nr:DUF1232 domain-containing protein [Shimazuella soli]MCH5584388.1 DUF1232 domain-containing protein [Shimazuella soli]